jgi:hypothetical protein
MPHGSQPVVAGPALRRSVRAALIGVVLVAGAGFGVPAAQAAQIARADVQLPVPDVAVDGTLHVQLAASPAPPDLDLSGARFDVLDSGNAIVGSCDTGGTGACDVPMSGYAGSPVVFRLVQDAGRPVPGLLPSRDVSTFTVCAADCPDSPVTVGDASLFRTGLAVTVQDGGTGAPLSGAEFSLTGPDYRRLPDAPQQAETTVFPDNPFSGGDGRLTFSGWFLPGEWSLTPEVTPRGYRSSGVLPVTLPAPGADGLDPWSTVVGLAADVPDVGVIGTGRPPIPPSAPPAPRPGPTPPAPRPAVASPVQAPPPAPASPPSAASAPVAPPAVPSTEAHDDGSALPPPAADSAAPATAPLRVSSATSLLDVGLIGFAALFVAVVALGVGYVRRRARP